ADINPSLAQSTVNDAITGGVMASSADNCEFKYLEASPNENPIYQDISSRDDFVAGKTLVDFMNTTNDSRITKYYGDVGGDYIGQTI
ncbi:SusD/RagB family nutrient-binding outer membrane lipoprotein, partial [Pseudomonas sp. SIMBA_041]